MTTVFAVQSVVPTAGKPVEVFSTFALAGVISNPLSAEDQGFSPTAGAQVLYVSQVKPATTSGNYVTIALQPGETWSFNESLTAPVYVNSKFGGHKFTAYQIGARSSYPPTPVVGPFPPFSPTTMTQVIPSYLYQQYQDDQDLQDFVTAQNGLAQDYIDTLNDLNLPIYTNDNIWGPLLDWVGAGIYGMPRPTLASYQTVVTGDYNTWEYNTLQYNQLLRLHPSNIIATTDDIYKRILTWHFLKGDGKYFSVNWLKRRVMRFLIGTNGTNPPIDQTCQISVEFGAFNTITIRFINFVLSNFVTSQYNAFQFNTTRYNDLMFVKTELTPLPNQLIFKTAVDSGALELPFQFQWNVQIQQ